MATFPQRGVWLNIRIYGLKKLDTECIKIPVTMPMSAQSTLYTALLWYPESVDTHFQVGSEPET